MADETVELKAPKDKGPEAGPVGALEEIDFAPLVDYFDMDRPNFHESNDLRDLYRLISGGESLSKGELLMRVRDLDMKLGSPATGEKRIKRMIRYLEIDQQLEELLKEQKAYIR